jgi:hypothetical protein
MREEKRIGDFGFFVDSIELVTVKKETKTTPQKIMINSESQKLNLLMAANMHQTFNTGMFTNEQDLKSIILWVGYENSEKESPHLAISFQYCKLTSLEAKLKSLEKSKSQNIRIILNREIVKDLEKTKENFLQTITKFKLSILSVKFENEDDLKLFGLFYPYYFSSPNDYFENAPQLSIARKLESKVVRFKYIIPIDVEPITEKESVFDLFDNEKRNALGSSFQLKIQDKLEKSIVKYNLNNLKFLCNEVLLKKHLEFFEKQKELNKREDKKIRFPNSFFAYYPTKNEKWKIFEEGAESNELGLDFIGNGIYLTTFPQKAIDEMLKNEEIKAYIKKTGTINLIAGYCIPGETVRVEDKKTRKGLDLESDANFIRIDNKDIPVDEKEDQYYDWIVVKDKHQFYPCFELSLRIKN